MTQAPDGQLAGRRGPIDVQRVALDGCFAAGLDVATAGHGLDFHDRGSDAPITAIE